MKCVLRSETSGFMLIVEYFAVRSKEALYLVYIEGMSYKEAAAVLRKSANRLISCCNSAKKK